VSPRRVRRRPEAAAPAPAPAAEVVEPWGDSAWVVRRVPGSPGKSYRCPGCDQTLDSAQPHVVAWPAEGLNSGLEWRRHWHSACWARRHRPGPAR
jgi:hypothetical protein